MLSALTSVKILGHARPPAQQGRSRWSGLTGVEAITKDVPAFREPKARRAMRTEVLLGSILGSMLLGLAFLTVRSHIGPSADQTVLSQVTSASVGRGFTYYAIDLATALISALAANTSFGGLPVLASLLARDSLVPHVFGLRADRPVYRYGVVALAVLAGLLLVAVNANTNSLIPLYTIGVFTGLTLSQTGLVRYWWRDRPRGWWAKSVVTPMLDYLGSPEIRRDAECWSSSPRWSLALRSEVAAK